jgi:hypothetical protein
MPMALSAQIGRLPRPSQRQPGEAGQPPEIPVVAKELSLKRSRWALEAYSLISAFQVPSSSGGGATSYTSFGTGTRGDYRLNDRFSATMDMTVSALGSPTMSETVEAGTRFTPGTWNADFRGIQPFFDLRAAYLHMYDTFATTGQVVAGTTNQAANGQRYSHGLGAVLGAGAAFPVTNTLAVTGEVTGMRSHMTTYRINGLANVPSGSSYPMTTFRFALGFKYNPVSALNLAQNPAK